MVAAAGRPWDQIGPHIHVGWDELHPGGWDPKARLAEQDRDGVAAEVLYPSVGMMLCNHPDADYKKACFDAYNHWIAEFATRRPTGWSGSGRPRCAASRRASPTSSASRELGLRGVMMPGFAGCHDDGR